MKPSFYVCGGGGEVNCSDWDDVNGCWQDMINVYDCAKFAQLNAEAEEDMGPGDEE